MSAVERVTFYSEGSRISGLLRRPASTPEGGLPAVIHAPGWMSLKDAGHYVPYYEALVEAGFAVLSFDYRGFGDSEGECDVISPHRQVVDARAAVSFLSGREDVDPARIGIFGSGGTGGGVSLFTAAVDTRVRCAAAMSPIADGRDWLASMRSAGEWRAFEARLEENRRAMATGAQDAQVDPLAEITIPPPERRQIGFKKDIAGRLPSRVGLSTADAISTFAPETVVARISPRPLLLILAVDDTAVPQRHTERLYQLAGAPKRLVRLYGTSSYRAHTTHTREISMHLVEWFGMHLGAPQTSRVEEVLAPNPGTGPHEEKHT